MNKKTTIPGTLLFILLLCMITCRFSFAGERRTDGRRIWEPPVTSAKSRIKVKIYLDKTDYKIGDTSKISVVADTDCYFLLYSVDSKNRASLVVPSELCPKDSLKKDRILYVTASSGESLQQMGPAGKETLRIIAAKDRQSLKEYLNTVRKGTPVKYVPRPYGINSISYKVK